MSTELEMARMAVIEAYRELARVLRREGLGEQADKVRSKFTYLERQLFSELLATEKANA